MGMDISGINPVTETGTYFRANCWSWRPIHALISIVNSISGDTLVPQDVMKGMSYNDGKGLKNQKDCNKLANHLANLLEHPEIMEEHGLVLEENEINFPVAKEPGMLVDENGRFVKPEKVDELQAKGVKLRSPYGTTRKHVEEFICFLKDCGGFKVW